MSGERMWQLEVNEQTTISPASEGREREKPCVAHALRGLTGVKQRLFTWRKRKSLMMDAKNYYITRSQMKEWQSNLIFYLQTFSSNCPLSRLLDFIYTVAETEHAPLSVFFRRPLGGGGGGRPL